MSSAGEFIAVVCGAVALLTAIGTVSLRKPLRAAVSLLAHIISLAGLYLTLHAHVLAAIQLLVYAGAVVVLFVFVIMLIGPDSETKSSGKGVVLRMVSMVVMLMIALTVAFSVGGIDLVAPSVEVCLPGSPPGCEDFGGVEQLGMALYTKAALPFELVSITLLVAVIGAIAVARGRSAKEAEAARELRANQKSREALAAPGGN